MKKILIFSIVYLPIEVGGAELAIKEITDRIGSDEIIFDLVTPRFDKSFPVCQKIGNINIYRVGFGIKSPRVSDLGKFPLALNKFFFPLLALLKARQLNRKNNYDLCWAIMANQAGIAAALFKVFSKKRMLLTLQEGDEESHLERYALGNSLLYRIFIKPWHLLPIRKANYLTAISQGLKKRAIAHGVKSDLIEVVPNGVDIAKFKSKNEKDKSEILNLKLPVKENDKTVITVSRLVEKNGIGDLIEAINILKTQSPELKVKLLILGNGPLEENLKFKIKNLKLENEVFLLGYKAHDELPQYLALADIFVRPSLSEGLGNSFLEAMASGVPIIGTRVGGIPDFLKDPSASSGQATGLFCEVGNSQSIAEKIKLLFADENLRRKLIVNGRRLVEEKYNWDKLASKMQSIFTKAALA